MTSPDSLNAISPRKNLEKFGFAIALTRCQDYKFHSLFAPKKENCQAMLNAIREGTKTSLVIKIFIFSFMIMALGGLVFMDVGGYFRGGLGNTTIARVGSETVDVYEFQKIAERATRSQNLTMQDAYKYGFLNMVVQGLVAKSLTDQAAGKLDLEISKAQVEKTLGRVLDSYAQEGQTRADVLRMLLESQGMSESDLISETKSELKRALIRNAFASTTLLIPDATATAYKTFQAEQRDIAMFKIPAASVPFDKEPTEADLKALYEQTKSSYAIPEKRSIQMIQVSSGLFLDQVSLKEEDLLADYDARIEEFKIPERRYVEQVVASDETKARAVYDSAQKSGDLKKAAQSVLNDEGAYRPETHFERDGLLAALAGVVFDAKDMGILEPVQSPLGWHVMKLNKIEEPRTQNFGEVRKDMEREATQEATDQSLMDLLDKIESALTAGDTLEQIATAHNLDVITIENIPNNPDQASGLFAANGIFETGDLMLTIFSARQGEASDPVETDVESFAVLEVTNIKDASHQPFDEVKDSVKTAWTEKEKAENLRRAALDVTVRLNSNKDLSYKDAAAEFGQKPSVFTALSREQAVPDGLTDAAMNAIFTSTLMNNSIFLPDAEGGYIVFKTVKAYFPETLNDEPLSVQKLQITRPIEATMDELYYGYLHTNEKVVVNQNLIDALYGNTSDLAEEGL